MSETIPDNGSTSHTDGHERLDAVLVNALRTVIDPCSAATGIPLSLVDMGLIERASRSDSVATVHLRLTSPICWNAAPMMQAIRETLLRTPGITEVECTADHGLEWTPGHMLTSAHRRLQVARPVAQRNPYGPQDISLNPDVAEATGREASS